MNKNFFQTAGGVALSLGLLFATVWIASKAWKSGQDKKTA
jgi:hypothetical protein